MKEHGWDGYEETNKTQWALTGSLFYSIIVITTIGEFFFLKPKISFVIRFRLLKPKNGAQVKVNRITILMTTRFWYFDTVLGTMGLHQYLMPLETAVYFADFSIFFTGEFFLPVES